jgi:hypothetical protein
MPFDAIRTGRFAGRNKERPSNSTAASVDRSGEIHKSLDDLSDEAKRILRSLGMPKERVPAAETTITLENPNVEVAIQDADENKLERMANQIASESEKVLQ